MATSRSAKLARSAIYAVNARKTLSSSLHHRPNVLVSPALEAFVANTVRSNGVSSLAVSKDGVSSIKLYGSGVRNVSQLRLSSRSYSTAAASSSSQMSPSDFTEMAWEGLAGAVEAAKNNKQQIVESEHLMKALLEQKDGLARRILTKAGVDNTSVLQATDEFINKQPKVAGDTSGPMMGSHLNSLLDNARKHKKEFGDDFLSVEHFILAFISDKRFGQKLFKDLQLGEKELKEAVHSVRGNQRVTDQTWAR